MPRIDSDTEFQDLVDALQQGDTALVGESLGGTTFLRTSLDERDWVRFTTSPAWKEYVIYLDRCIAALNEDWVGVTDLQTLGRLAGSKETLETLKRHPYNIIEQLKASNNPEPLTTVEGDLE